MGKIRMMKITLLMNEIKALNKWGDVLYSWIGRQYSRDANSSQTRIQA